LGYGKSQDFGLYQMAWAIGLAGIILSLPAKLARHKTLKHAESQHLQNCIIRRNNSGFCD
jgi:hypothetical protein